MKELSSHNRDSLRAVGLIGSLTMLGFASSEYSESGLVFQFLADEGQDIQVVSIYLLFAALFLISAIFVSLKNIQVWLFFLLSAFQSSQAATRHYGLGFSVVAAMILLRRGWFLRMPVIKTSIILAIGVLALVGPSLVSGGDLRALPSALIWAGAFAVIVVGLARRRCLSALAPKKRVLRLSDFHLSNGEKLVVKMRISGKSAKEIACENEISPSTVRNVLSRSYRKLGIEGGEELMAMGERYTVE
jgi:DNA-binding CsgD family transcriptional regulator